MATVWVLETIFDHEPGWIRGVYTTKDLAKAGAPNVREWAPDGDLGAEVEVTLRPFADAWLVTPFPLDPEPATP